MTEPSDPPTISLDEARKKREAEERNRSKPLIQIRGGELAFTAQKAEEILIQAGAELYQRGGKLVRPVIAEHAAAHGAKTRIARLKVVDATYLRMLLSRFIHWQRYDQRQKKWTSRDPPKDIAETILAGVGDWAFRTITGVISTPTLRPDGSLLAKPGYDRETGLLLMAGPDMPPIPDRPSRAEALDALATLKALLREFSFVDPLSQAVALSAIITVIARGAFPVAPMHLIKAPAAGSGKSYLADVVAAVGIGQLMPVMAAGRTEEETEKRLGAALLSGQPLISIDNVNGELGGSALCQVIERQRVMIRILGRSELIEFEGHRLSMFATGNNAVVTGDMCRRVVTANLDAHLENPELRQFSGDPVATVLADRGRYVADAIIVCRAYLAAGRPLCLPKLASFEGWSDLVRAALVWLGEADCLEAVSKTRDEDPIRTELYATLKAWLDAFGEGYQQRRTLAHVVASATRCDSHGVKLHPALEAAIKPLATNSKTRELDPKVFGLWLRSHKGRIVSGLRFNALSDPKGGSQWWVEQA